MMVDSKLTIAFKVKRIQVSIPCAVSHEQDNYHETKRQCAKQHERMQVAMHTIPAPSLPFHVTPSFKGKDVI